MKRPLKMMFVCAGNICRSPLAHAMFDHMAGEQKLAHLFQTESSGTNGYHVGEPPDPRTRANAEQHGLEVGHISRKFEARDLQDYDLLLVMDQSNYRSVTAKANSENERNKVHLFREWDSHEQGAEVPDPYMDDETGFERVYQIVKRTTGRLIQDLVEKLKD